MSYNIIYDTGSTAQPWNNVRFNNVRSFNITVNNVTADVGNVDTLNSNNIINTQNIATTEILCDIGNFNTVNSGTINNINDINTDIINSNFINNVDSIVSDKITSNIITNNDLIYTENLELNDQLTLQASTGTDGQIVAKTGGLVQWVTPSIVSTVSYNAFQNNSTAVITSGLKTREVFSVPLPAPNLLISWSAINQRLEFQTAGIYIMNVNSCINVIGPGNGVCKSGFVTDLVLLSPLEFSNGYETTLNNSYTFCYSVTFTASVGNYIAVEHELGVGFSGVVSLESFPYSVINFTKIN